MNQLPIVLPEAQKNEVFQAFELIKTESTL